MSLSRYVVVRGEVGVDSVASVAHTRVYLATPKDSDSEVAAAADIAVEAAVEAVVEAAVEAAVEVAVEVAVEAAVDKRQIVARNPVDNAANTVEEVTVEAAIDKQVAAHNPIDSAVDIVEGMAVRNSEGGNPTDYIAPTVCTPAAVALAGVR